MKDALAKTLLTWDGKATAPLEAIFNDYRDHPGFLVTLIEFCETEELQRSATWLLKHNFDCKGAPLSDTLAAQHVRSFPRLAHWEAKLHVLQYLDRLSLTAGQEATVCAFVDGETVNENRLVRAWAYFGLSTLARTFPDRKEASRDHLKAAQQRETAGSIKVRIRKALEKLEQS